MQKVVHRGIKNGRATINWGIDETVLFGWITACVDEASSLTEICGLGREF
jgi:hypothetical protein